VSRRHGALLLVTAGKFSGQPDNMREAREWLALIASTEGEQGVLDAVNACLPLV
jgi:hypothetical protein